MRLLASPAPQPPLWVAIPDASRVPPTRTAAANGEQKPEGDGSAEITQRLVEDRDRMSQSLSVIVVHRLFAAGLDLQTALGLIGAHPATEKVQHAVGELDQALRDIRDTVFDRLSES